MIGPPDKISNIRPVLFHIPENESLPEKEYRLIRQEVLQWNQEFWTDHNTRFVKVSLNSEKLILLLLTLILVGF